MKYRGIIFDLDGVICHTDKYHYQAWKQVADQLGIYFDETINNRLRGVSRMESFEIILERYDGAMSESWLSVLPAEMPASSWDSWDLTVTSTPFRTAIRSPIPNRTRKSFCWPRS